MKTVQNINQLRSLIMSGPEIKKCLKRPNDLTARANAATRTITAQIAYHISRGERPEIPFMDVMKKAKARVLNGAGEGNRRLKSP
jgi:hypothetical protein